MVYFCNLSFWDTPQTLYRICMRCALHIFAFTVVYFGLGVSMLLACIASVFVRDHSGVITKILNNGINQSVYRCVWTILVTTLPVREIAPAK